MAAPPFASGFDAAVLSAGAWHTRSATAVLSDFGSSVDGLTPLEATLRLKRYGFNVMPAPARTSVWRMLWSQIASIVVALLVAAAAVALITGDFADAAAIGAVLVIDVSIGFFTEWRARGAMSALLNLDVLRATVVREGVRQGPDATTLVPGDIIDLEEGQLVPSKCAIALSGRASCRRGDTHW